MCQILEGLPACTFAQSTRPNPICSSRATSTPQSEVMACIVEQEKKFPTEELVAFLKTISVHRCALSTVSYSVFRSLFSRRSQHLFTLTRMQSRSPTLKQGFDDQHNGFLRAMKLQVRLHFASSSIIARADVSDWVQPSARLTCARNLDVVPVVCVFCMNRRSSSESARKKRCRAGIKCPGCPTILHRCSWNTACTWAWSQT